MPKKTRVRQGAVVGLLTIGVAAVAVFLDQWSKAWAVANLVEKDVKPVLGDFFSLNLVFNSGAAFSLGENATWIFTIISTAVVLGIIWLVVTNKIRSYWLAVIFGLIAGGAAGNLLDRLEVIDRGIPKSGIGRGHVVDFLDYNGWFVGNVADLWIFFGFIFLAGYFLAVGDRPDGEDTQLEVTKSQSEPAEAADDQATRADD